MKKTILIFLSAFLLLAAGCRQELPKPARLSSDMNPSREPVADHKIVIYQVMTRLFGNKKTKNKIWGSRSENGVGKFNDFTDTALKAIHDLGVTHLWYTGVIAHAVCADYTKYGVRMDDADVIKGRAGSPYAIKDYYDVNPDLAVNPAKRMVEFKALIRRTRKAGMKVLIDFVPNHVARGYKSLKKPRGVKNLGESDKTGLAFSPKNDFYYVPGSPFQLPGGNYTPGPGNTFPTKDGKFAENPAKVTGNDKFTASPSVNDWFETVKLNYGVDIQNGRRKHFRPTPPLWYKMRDILIFWLKQGVDGFRCDMAEMVPVEFWAWVIPQLKRQKPSMIMVAEIYNPAAYREYIFKGRFDYLYDKVGLYDNLRQLMSGSGDANSIYYSWRSLMTLGKKKSITSRMLRFLENHDEQRIASSSFAGDPWTAVPAMTVSATLGSGPVMLYFGQTVGEPGRGREGFSGNDGRTSIFDYWGVPEHQKWMNGGAFDGGKLSPDQKKLQDFYRRLCNLVTRSEAIRSGQLYDLQFANEKNFSAGYNDRRIYAYIRYTKTEKLLILVNFDRKAGADTYIKIPARCWNLMGLKPSGEYVLKDILNPGGILKFRAETTLDRWKSRSGIPVSLPPKSARIYRFQ